MIKFVCASCGERLSVPDEHGGRKGLCPTCHAVNRIPLRGFPETKPDVPTIARPDGKLATTPAPPRHEYQHVAAAPTLKAHSTADEVVELEPDDLDGPPSHSAVAVSMNPIPETVARNPSTRVSQVADRVTDEPAKFTSEMVTEVTTPAAPLRQRTDRKLPKPIKITLLLLAALGIVAGLYFGLYYSLHALLRAMTPPT